MEQRRAEIEQLYAECEKAHRESIKLGRIAIAAGIIATIACGAAGVWSAYQGKTVLSFFEFFLCVSDAAMVRNTWKRHEQEIENWAEFEARHRFMITVLDTIQGEEVLDET